MKEFSDKDVLRTGSFPTIYTNNYREDLVYSPPPWMAKGLQETASGYGKKLNTGFNISFNGKMYRVYCTIFSNIGSCWFTVKGERIYVN